jgi:exodeoxyribonuclease III
MKILSWNVNGLRAILGKDFIPFLRSSGADVVCLQEIKARPEQVVCDFTPYSCAWNPAERPGYAGTAILSRTPPLAVRNGIGDPAHDNEGRVITAEFEDFFVVCVYVPNVGRTLSRLDYRIRGWSPAFLRHLRSLERTKPVVFCGDLNVARHEIDLARPRENVGNAGFTDEERAALEDLLAAGFIDTFREFEPGGGHYTWWSYQSSARQRNIGWRIDYVCISKSLRPHLRNAFILPNVGGSDHCPVGADLARP